MQVHIEPGYAVRRNVIALALACVLIATSAAGPARAAALKKCPAASSLSSAAGTQMKLNHQGKLAGQLVCAYITHGAALADVTVQTLSNSGLSAAAELKKLEAGEKASRYKVTVLHGLGSAAFEATLKGSSALVDVVSSGHIFQVGSLVLSPSRVVAVARAVAH